MKTYMHYLQRVISSSYNLITFYNLYLSILLYFYLKVSMRVTHNALHNY